MTTLARIHLNPASPVIVRDLGDPVALHRRTMSAFAQIERSPAREALSVLWRLDTDAARRPFLLVQSGSPGSWDDLPSGWATSVEAKEIGPLLDGLRAGQRCRFLLRANATRKVNTKTGDDGRRRNGQRVPLRSPERALEWLARKGQAAGFELAKGTTGPSVEVRPEPPATGGRGGSVVTVEAVRFEGQLIVTDAVRLAQAVRAGVGPAKAYGCGLLSLAPLSR